MSLKVFYLDDEPDLLQLFMETFQTDQIQISTFDNPDYAISEAKTNPPDVFFIDYRLPLITGDKVAGKVPSSIYKVLVTGDLNLNLNYSFDQIVEKPFKILLIQNTLKDLLAKKLAKLGPEK